MGWKLRLIWELAIGAAITLGANCAIAQITPDSTLPNNSSVKLEENTRIISGGTQAGSNLFHSFSEFSVPTGATAVFNNAADIQNIISRVTGKSISNIDGVLKANARANLFLLNPSGIIFGTNARLDIGGSFVASTASSLKFADGFEFSATVPSSAPLLSINVPIGLQYGMNPGRIVVQGDGQGLRSTSDLIDTIAGLRVRPNQTLALVGGDVSLEGATLKAVGGRIELGSVTASGFVSLTPISKGFSFGYDKVQNFGNIQLSQQAAVDSSGEDGGDIQVWGKSVTLTNGSQIEASTLGTEQGGNLIVNASDSVQLFGSSIDSEFPTGLFANGYPSATGAAGDLTINTRALLVRDGGQVSASTFGQGNAGSINIATGLLEVLNGARLNASTSGRGEAGSVNILARDHVSFDGVGSSNLPSAALANVEENAVGKGGNVNITAGSLSVTNGAELESRTRGRGDAGSINILARDRVSFDGVGSNGWISGAYSTVESKAFGNAGGINITTGSLEVLNGARLNASISGRGEAGSVNILARDHVSFDGVGSSNLPSAALANVEENAVGKGGNVNITAGSLSVTNGAELESRTRGRGDAGSINILARDSVSFDGVGSNGWISGAYSTVESKAFGNAGGINITTGSLLVRDGGQVSASTFGAGNAGNLTIKADSVQLIGVSSNGRSRSTLLSETKSTGAAGNLTINTRELLVQNIAYVSARTYGAGNAGNLTVNADSVELTGNSPGGDASTLIVASERRATGAAGDLTINTGKLSLQDGAQVSAATWGSKKGGNLKVTADSVQVIGIGTSSASSLNTNAFSTATGAAGDLTINTRELLVRDGGEVSARTYGAGNGGNLTITADSVQVIGTSGLFTQAQDSTGAAGNLTINTRALLVRDGGQASASTYGTGNGGNLTVKADSVQLIGASSINPKFRSTLLSETKSTGTGGNLIINTRELLVQNTAYVSTRTYGAGNAGNLTVNADSVKLTGNSPGGDASTLIVASERRATGAAGNLTINTSKLSLQDGAQVSAATWGPKKGGNLKVTADSVQVIGIGTSAPSSLNTNAFPTATGAPGDLTINTRELLVRDGGQVSASTFGTGNGGNLTVTADSVQVIGTSGLFTQAQDSTGAAGNLTINARALLVRDRSIVSVQSLGKGNAGNLNVNARFVSLDNATLTANTQSINADPNKEQATINLRSVRNLIMRRGSKITTNARGGNVIGGNINIDTDVLAAFENSDISANSANFRGGRVTINTQGIFGIQFRDVASDKTSDITATGGRPEYSGTVEINTPDVDPNSGLINLPAVPVDTSVAQSCTAGGTVAKSEFIITGRGGLPQNPGETLTSNAVQVNLVTLKPEVNKHFTPRVSTNFTKSAPPPIVEATGWVRSANGDVVLTVEAPTTAPRYSWHQTTDCHALNQQQER